MAYILKYDPETGIFTRNGKPIPDDDADLYGRIYHAGIRWRRHVLAWYLTYGYRPTEIDHINRNHRDNRLCNLREVTHSINMHNRNDGAKGVEKHGRKYRVRIFVENVRRTIGSFDTYEQAVEAYQGAKNELRT